MTTLIEGPKGQNIPEDTPAPIRPRRPLRQLKKILFAAVALLAVGGICFLLGSRSALQAKETLPELSTVSLEGKLRAADELATMSYYYTNMGQFKNSTEFYGVTLPFTTKSFILTYDGVIKAGVVLGEAQITGSDATVSVLLPRAKILSHTIDEESLKVFDEKTSIFNPFTVEDYNGFQRDQKKVMEEKALQNGLLERAQSQAETAVRELLEPMLPQGVILTVSSVQ